LEYPKGRDLLGDLGVYQRIILKLISSKECRIVRNLFMFLRKGGPLASYEYDNDTSGLVEDD
jgi:hypothetical protein